MIWNLSKIKFLVYSQSDEENYFLKAAKLLSIFSNKFIELLFSERLALDAKFKLELVLLT
jgi:hypothetical protein